MGIALGWIAPTSGGGKEPGQLPLRPIAQSRSGEHCEIAAICQDADRTIAAGQMCCRWCGAKWHAQSGLECAGPSTRLAERLNHDP